MILKCPFSHKIQSSFILNLNETNCSIFRYGGSNRFRLFTLVIRKPRLQSGLEVVREPVMRGERVSEAFTREELPGSSRETPSRRPDR
jgi:hypothetical protein